MRSLSLLSAQAILQAEAGWLVTAGAGGSPDTVARAGEGIEWRPRKLSMHRTHKEVNLFHLILSPCEMASSQSPLTGLVRGV